ncbi:acetyl-CoA carboxylase, biotin carboxyl carrier protein [Anopheles sinensis]|uniref:Acetyl-CoA carboxylase, biotin carboxyl carrier protein n=1 Tax=Anopheles sinensis TaxID=74873 RepID=A0A084WK78_ANOSI|nr:acetyl-CoA carboxylase, biotin carboxyl carrier protein [Anopheles sinensis]
MKIVPSRVVVKSIITAYHNTFKDMHNATVLPRTPTHYRVQCKFYSSPATDRPPPEPDGVLSGQSINKGRPMSTLCVNGGGAHQNQPGGTLRTLSGRQD